jgi:hypothetical protein
MVAISSPQPSAQYNAAILYADYPGNRDDVPEEAVLVSHKLMRISLYHLRHNTNLIFDQDFNAHLVVAAILLCFEDRYAIREEILDTLAQLLAIATCLGNITLDQVLGMPDGLDSGGLPT